MVNNDDLVNDYASGLSLGKVAKKHGLKIWDVQKALKAAGVELRTKSDAATLAHGTVLPSAELAAQLVSDYDKGKLSLKATATKNGVKIFDVQRALNAAGIPLRDAKTASIIARPKSDPSPEERAEVLALDDAQWTRLQIAKKTGLTRWTVNSVLVEAGRRLRSRKEAAHLARPKHQVALEYQALVVELAEGLLLGDGHIAPGGELSVSQSIRRKPWIDSVAVQLQSYGVECNVTTRKGSVNENGPEGRRIIAGERVDLRTLTYDLFAKQRDRWYLGPSARDHSLRELRELRKKTGSDDKIVPRDLRLTPMSVGHWVNGDGSPWSHGGLCFCTNSFTNDEVHKLKFLLQFDLGVESNVINARIDKPDQFILHIGRRDEAVKLRDKIFDYVHECCRYKFDKVHASTRPDYGGHAHKIEPNNEGQINWDTEPLGEEPDSVLAQLKGVSESAVAIARRRRGIASHRDRLRLMEQSPSVAIGPGKETKLWIAVRRRLWSVTHKMDQRCRELADRHYTRQTPGHPMWTRPGYNFVLFFEDEKGAAVFCWWRPKWEVGQERFDGLRALECTIFRNESSMLSSSLIVDAILALDRNAVQEHLKLDKIPRDGLITGIGSKQTELRRSKHVEPGRCFRIVGFESFDHASGNADVWLRYTGSLPPITKDEGSCAD
jgi:hypothetical protein